MNRENFFDGCKDQVSIKKRYRELVFEHHPDKGGDTATMQAINAQYQEIIRKGVEAYAKEEGKNESFVDWWMEQEGMIFDIISKLVLLDGLEVELLGVWIWVTGNTKEHKEALKELGFFWSKQKVAWYWRSKEHKSTKHRSAPKTDLEDLRGQWGSKKAKKSNVLYLGCR